MRVTRIDWAAIVFGPGQTSAAAAGLPDFAAVHFEGYRADREDWVGRARSDTLLRGGVPSILAKIVWKGGAPCPVLSSRKTPETRRARTSAIWTPRLRGCVLERGFITKTLRKCHSVAF